MEDILKDIEEIYGTHRDKPNKNLYKHNSIQRDLIRLADKYGYVGKEEVKAIYSKRNGKCDVVWLQDNIPVLAIEIDSRVRKKSVEKLLSFDCQKIWIVYAENKPWLRKTVSELDKEKQIIVLSL